MIKPTKELCISDNLSLKALKLNFSESAILKMYILNYSEFEIQKLLEIEADEYHLVIDNLFFKYSSLDLFETALLGISFGQIDRYDLVKDEIKKLALKYSEYIYDYLVASDYIIKKENLILDVLLNEFIVKAYMVFIKNRDFNASIKLTTKEITYCKFRIYNIGSNNSEEMNQFVTANKNIENILKDKLEVSNFFNVIRSIFELQLVERTTFFKNYNDFSKMVKTVIYDKIVSVNAMNKITAKEKRLYIYFDLLNYYNMLEDKLLNI
ncbi:hypothetical protein [Confluentibacter sediminis]|uniref:hypothetical protein n=1 Tax=Confluentibacter sediminis TaxID=2219045 RepID=UPI000DAB8AB7|nr:hypothetical protein [Confluentibacter sediminis]